MRIEIYRRTHADLGWLARGLLWLVLALLTNTASVQAESPARIITEEQLTAVLRQHVLRNGPWKSDYVDVRVVGFQPIALPAGPVRYRIVKPTKGVMPGPQNFLVAADVAGKEQARVWVKSEISIFENVVVTSYPLAHNRLVKAEDLRIERRDITALPGRPFTRIDEVVGQQVARATPLNQILTQRSVEHPTLVRRGSSVTLVYESSSLRVETPGFADEGGKAGDLIQVRNTASGKSLRGTVVDGRLVRVN